MSCQLVLLCNLWLNWETYLVLLNMYDICPGLVLQCEFDGVHFAIRLAIFGNLFVFDVCICIIHHFSVQIWP